MYFTEKAYAISTCYSSNDYVDLSKASTGHVLVKHQKKKKKKKKKNNYHKLFKSHSKYHSFIKKCLKVNIITK